MCDIRSVTSMFRHPLVARYIMYRPAVYRHRLVARIDTLWWLVTSCIDTLGWVVFHVSTHLGGSMRKPRAKADVSIHTPCELCTRQRTTPDPFGGRCFV